MSPRAWLLANAQSLVGALGRAARQPFGTSLTAAVIGAAIALPLLMFVFLDNTSRATANWNQNFTLSAYLDKKAPSTRTQSLASHLRSRPDVAAVRVITAAEALVQFRRTSGFGDSLDALTDNPLPDTLIVTPSAASSNPQGIEALRKAVAGAPDVDTVQLDTEWVERLYATLSLLRRIAWFAGIALAIGVVLVVGNTVRLDILNRRAEIEVLTLVGATDGFARRPFLYTGAWYGFLGGLVALVVVSAGIWLTAGPIDRLASLYGSDFRLQGVSAITGWVTLACSIALGWLGSWAAATRFIRALDPS